VTAPKDGSIAHDGTEAKAYAKVVGTVDTLVRGITRVAPGLERWELVVDGIPRLRERHGRVPVHSCDHGAKKKKKPGHFGALNYVEKRSNIHQELRAVRPVFGGF
jgi:hypothetical protein